MYILTLAYVCRVHVVVGTEWCKPFHQGDLNVRQHEGTASTGHPPHPSDTLVPSLHYAKPLLSQGQFLHLAHMLPSAQGRSWGAGCEHPGCEWNALIGRKGFLPGKCTAGKDRGFVQLSPPDLKLHKYAGSASLPGRRIPPLLAQLVSIQCRGEK